MFCYTYYSSVLPFVDSFYQFVVKAYERTVECFKLLNRSQFVTSSAIFCLFRYVCHIYIHFQNHKL